MHGSHIQRSDFIGTHWQLVIFLFHVKSWTPLSTSARSHSSASWWGRAPYSQGLLCPSLVNLLTSIPNPANTHFSRARCTLDRSPWIAPTRISVFFHPYFSENAIPRTQVQQFFPEKSVHIPPPSIICYLLFVIRGNFCWGHILWILSFHPHHIPVR